MAHFTLFKKLKGTEVCALIFILVVNILTFSGCQQAKPVLSKAGTVDSPSAASINAGKPEKVVIGLSLVGDIMVHADQLASAYDNRSGKYSFHGFFEDVRDYLGSADLTMGNLETTVATREKGYSGYPQFNTPREILTALREAGFDVLTTANNHSMDRREYGILKTIEHLDEAGIKHTGTFSSAEERSKVLIIDIRGVKVALLAYTYGTNGIPVPAGKSHLVNLLDLQQIQKDVSKARAEGADVVLVSLHFGIEYRRFPGEEERQLVEEVFRAGADIIAGSHPHVLQPMVRRDLLADADGLFVAYSLGNFISGQRGRYKDSGVILNLKLEKDMATGKIRLLEAAYIPTWVHKYREKGKTRFRVVAVEKAIRDYEQRLDGRLTARDYERLQQVWQETTSLLSSPEGPSIRHI